MGLVVQVGSQVVVLIYFAMPNDKWRLQIYKKASE